MAKSQRYAFLDVLRAIAVIWMIQVHVTNVFLDTELRSGWFFTLLNISNGFVAPTFIFCAGGGLWIALSRKGAQYLALDPSLWQYLKRLAYILFWAYVLHMPAWSLVEMTTLPTDVLFTGFQVDVLQTIVYSSLFAVATFFLMRDLSRTSWTLAGLCVIIWLTTGMEERPPACPPGSHSDHGIAPSRQPFPLDPVERLPLCRLDHHAVLHAFGEQTASRTVVRWCGTPTTSIDLQSARVRRGLAME
jgi:predicted acyltransferase